VLEELLVNMTFRVDLEPGGKEALYAIQRAADFGNPYDLVFLDWRMPDMDGVETAKAVRNLPLKVFPHPVLVTAYGREEIMREAEGAGLENVLSKPVNASYRGAGIHGAAFS
jgi:two-component system sensor histidine kinase/response regulator